MQEFNYFKNSQLICQSSGNLRLSILQKKPVERERIVIFFENPTVSGK